MSQAVSAPSTGDPFVAPGKSPKLAGKSPGFTGQESPSRRAVLAGMMLAPAVVAVPATAAAAATAPDWEHPIDLTHRVDAKFWSALREWRRVDQAWKQAIAADHDMPDGPLNDWGDQESKAEWAMLSTPIRTMRALTAKIDHVRSQELEVFAMREGGMICIMDLLAQDTHRMLFRDYAK